MLAAPAIVSALFPPASVLWVLIVLPVRVRSPPLSVTAPAYVCSPVVVISAPRSVVPVMFKLLRPVYAPSMLALPVIVRLWLAPASVLWVLITLPVKVRSPPLSVTAPWYVCAPLVVISAPKSLAPVMLKLLRPLYAPSMLAAPAIVSALFPPASVLWVLIVLPVKVRSPPLSVTAPWYVCAPLVVMLAPTSEVPVMLRPVSPV